MEILMMVCIIFGGITAVIALSILLSINYWMLINAIESCEFMDWAIAIGYFTLICTAVTGGILIILANQ